MTDEDREAGRLRVAIVGLGPKGLFALERLVDHAHRLGARMDIDLFEPHPVAGAGPVYDPAQPAYLRMNFAADHLDMWTPESRCVPERERTSFVAWRREGADAGTEDPYPPRAQVGRYLADGLARVLCHAPPGASIALRPVAVRELECLGSAWRVHAAGFTTDYDEILVTVGHGIAIDPLAAGLAVDAPLVSAVFPVERRLSPERVAPGAVVAVRGFALTFLDAALALTEGRGGRFEPGGRPHRLRYVAGEADAGVILPFSRTGRPMLAKPGPKPAGAVAALAAIARTGSARLLALPDGFAVARDLLAILAATAAAALRAATGEPLPRATATARAWLQTACEGVAPPCGQTPYAEIARSLDVGAGLRPPDLAWALGHTWRSVYPALVRRLGDGGLGDGQWPAFRRLAGQLERVSFGPPPVNAAKLLALIDAGRVDLSYVAAGHVVGTSIRGARGERAVDVVVNAVLAAPGAPPGSETLLGRLLAARHAQILDGRRGLDVGADAAAVGRGGTPTPGLSVIGRATEDSVTGNDTLSRALHPHPDRWALRVAHRAVHRAAAPAVAAPSPGSAP